MKPAAHTRHAVVAGAADGAALQALLASRRFDRVTLLTTRRFLRMPMGMDHAVLDADDWRTGLPPDADHAVLCFGAVRREREALIWHPARAHLVDLAHALRERGVATLDIVLAPGALPLDATEREQLAQLGFERLCHGHPAPPWSQATGRWPERLAAWMIRTVLDGMRQVARSHAHPERQPDP